jgi:carboxyl-terminal processing protease
LRTYIYKFVFVVALLISSVRGNAQADGGIKFAKLLNWLENYYVDTVNVDKLADRAIIELLQKLDPHSSYATKEEVDELNEPLKGNFEGIGITFSVFRDTIMVLSPLVGGPSEKAGIKAGDRIVMIDKIKVAGAGLKSDDIFSKLRGKKGSQVELTIKRKGSSNLLSYTVTRDKIPIHSVEASYKVSGSIGYIKISRFSSNTLYEFRSALNKLRKQKVNSLILDLTGNGGGFLDVAVSLTDEFLDNQKLIVYTQGNHNPKKEYMTSGKGNFEKGRLVVLIDESSASASEIFAGAIQDWDRGIIVGRRSFGKGLVQRPLMFPDGSMVRLTIARYYTPTGRLIQKSYQNGYQDYSKDLLRRVNNGELTDIAKYHSSDTSKFYTLVKKRVVYGGGGITPDIFIPLDTASYRREVRTVVAKGVVNRFVIDYVDQNRELILNKYKLFAAFNSRFPDGESILDLLKAFYKSENGGIELQLTPDAQKYMLDIVKSYIARDLWGVSEFYQVLNQTEDEFKTALHVFEDWDSYLTKLQMK